MFQIRRMCVFKSGNSSHSYKSLAQLCHQELIEQMRLFFNFYVSHGSATTFKGGENYCIYFVHNSVLFPAVKNFQNRFTVDVFIAEI